MKAKFSGIEVLGLGEFRLSFDVKLTENGLHDLKQWFGKWVKLEITRKGYE